MISCTRKYRARNLSSPAMAILFVAFFRKLVVPSQVFNVFQNIWNELFFLLKSVQLIFDNSFLDAHLHNLKQRFLLLDLFRSFRSISFSVKQITNASRVVSLLMYVKEKTNFIIFKFEQTQSFKRIEIVRKSTL